MDRYIIQQEASGWFWRREGARDRGGWFGWVWYDPPISGGPFATAEDTHRARARLNEPKKSRRCAGKSLWLGQLSVPHAFSASLSPVVAHIASAAADQPYIDGNMTSISPMKKNTPS